MTIPFLAVGNDELGNPVKKGDHVVSEWGLRGVVEYGKDETGKETNKLGFITVTSGNTYLVSVAGKLLKDWRVRYESI